MLFTCGVNAKTSASALRLAMRNPKVVRAFIGVHPSEVGKRTDIWWLPRALEKATGLGEVGLDPKYSPIGPRSAQLKVFQSQLELAEERRKPIQLHSRDAELESLDVTSRYSLTSVLMHWFQAEEVLDRVMGRGYFISFGPALLYSKKLRRMAAKCDRSLTMVETDSPVAYSPLGGVHGPWLVPSVIHGLSEAWGTSFEEAGETVFQNSLRYLGSAEKG